MSPPEGDTGGEQTGVYAGRRVAESVALLVSADVADDVQTRVTSTAWLSNS